MPVQGRIGGLIRVYLYEISSCILMSVILEYVYVSTFVFALHSGVIAFVVYVVIVDLFCGKRSMPP